MPKRFYFHLKRVLTTDNTRSHGQEPGSQPAVWGRIEQLLDRRRPIESETDA